ASRALKRTRRSLKTSFWVFLVRLPARTGRPGARAAGPGLAAGAAGPAGPGVYCLTGRAGNCPADVYMPNFSTCEIKCCSKNMCS
ncbi:Translation initiation factor IF-2, partial [Frankliniella fusca]